MKVRFIFNRSVPKYFGLHLYLKMQDGLDSDYEHKYDPAEKSRV